MPIDWKSDGAFNRLLAAVVAAQEMKLDYRKIATYYGQGATYDAIEGRFRHIKRDAKALAAEVQSGERGDAPARGARSVTSTPKKPRKNSNKENNASGSVTGTTSEASTPKSNNHANGTGSGGHHQHQRVMNGRVTKPSQNNASFGANNKAAKLSHTNGNASTTHRAISIKREQHQNHINNHHHNASSLSGDSPYEIASDDNDETTTPTSIDEHDDDDHHHNGTTATVGDNASYLSFNNNHNSMVVSSSASHSMPTPSASSMGMSIGMPDDSFYSVPTIGGSLDPWNSQSGHAETSQGGDGTADLGFGGYGGQWVGD